MFEVIYSMISTREKLEAQKNRDSRIYLNYVDQEMEWPHLKGQRD